MNSKNLVIVCVWAFVLVIVGGFVAAGILWTDYNMMANVFNVGLLLFFIASLVTGVLVYVTPQTKEGEAKLLEELHTLQLKLAEFTGEIERLKRLSSG